MNPRLCLVGIQHCEGVGRCISNQFCGRFWKKSIYFELEWQAAWNEHSVMNENSVKCIPEPSKYFILKIISISVCKNQNAISCFDIIRKNVSPLLKWKEKVKIFWCFQWKLIYFIWNVLILLNFYFLMDKCSLNLITTDSSCEGGRGVTGKKG